MDALDEDKYSALVIFTDDLSFTSESIFNIRIEHIWAERNPHLIALHTIPLTWGQVLLVLNWLSLTNCQTFCQTFDRVFLEQVLQTLTKDMWFIHDGALPHLSTVV